MSLEFNRRSFLKYTAAAAVVVAGSSLLTGCSTEFAKTLKKFGTIDNMDVKANLSSCSYTEAGSAGTDPTFGNELAFKFEAKNNHTNPVYLGRDSFTVTVKYTVTKSDGTTETQTKIYGSASGNDYLLTNDLINCSSDKVGIPNGKSASGYIYLRKAPEMSTISSITVLYHCDAAFSKYADVWELTYKDTDTNFKKVTSMSHNENNGVLTITE